MEDLGYNNGWGIDSTENNEYADGEQDEILWDQDLYDTRIPISEEIDRDADDEAAGVTRERPHYNEQDYIHYRE